MASHGVSGLGVSITLSSAGRRTNYGIMGRASAASKAAPSVTPQGGKGPRPRRAGPEGGPKEVEAAPRGQDPIGPLTCKGKKGAARRRRMQLSDFALGVRGG